MFFVSLYRKKLAYREKMAISKTSDLTIIIIIIHLFQKAPFRTLKVTLKIRTVKRQSGKKIQIKLQ